MFVPVIVALLYTFASADEVLTTISEQRSTKTSEDIYETCYTTGYTIQGMKWSSCSSGKRTLIGCVTNEGEKVKFGTIWKDGKAEWICEQEGDEVVIKPRACVKDGKVHRVGTTFLLGSFFYECVPAANNGLAIAAAGCADSFETLVPIGDLFNKGNFMFRCEMSGGKIVSVGEKCLVENPSMQAYSIGSRWVDGEYVFECQKKGNRGIRTGVVACADKQGKTLEAGDRYISGAVMMECQERDDGFTHAPVACFARDHRGQEFRQYEIGERWFESYKEDFGYWMQCTEDFSRKPVGCTYQDGNKTLSLDVNCGALWKNKIFVCKQVDKNSVMARLMRYPDETPFDRFLSEHGLGSCDVVVKTAGEE